MSFGEKKKVSVDPTAKWSVTFMNEMSKSRGTSRTGDTFNKALFSLIKADIKEPARDQSMPQTARTVNSSANAKLGNTSDTPEPSSDSRVDVPGDRRSRGLTRSFSMNEITAMLAQPAPEEEIRGPEPTPSPKPADSEHPDTSTEASSDTCQTETSTTSASSEMSDSGIIQSTPRSDSGTTPTESTNAAKNRPVTEAAALNNSTANSVPNGASDDTCQTETPTTSVVEKSPASDALSTEPVTRVKVPPLPVSPRVGHRHTRSVGSPSMLEHVISPRSKNSNGAPTSPRDSVSPRASPRSKNSNGASTSPRDSVSPRASPRGKSDTSPRELVNTTGAVIGASATDATCAKNSSEKPSSKDKKRTLKKRSSKRTQPSSTISSPAANNSAANNSVANNSNSDDSADSPRSIKATPNKARRVSNSVSQIGGYRRGSIAGDTRHSPRARTLKHAPKLDASAIESTSEKLNLDYMDEVLVSIQEQLLFPSVKSEFSLDKLRQMPLAWVMQRMPLLRARRDLAFKHHMRAKQLRSGPATSPLKKDHVLSNMTRWSSSDINKIRPGPSQSASQTQSLTNTPVKAASNNNLRHVRAGSGNQRRVASIQLIPASPRDSDPNKDSKSSPKSGEEVKK